MGAGGALEPTEFGISEQSTERDSLLQSAGAPSARLENLKTALKYILQKKF